MTAIETLRCQGSVWRDGIDRLCGQSVGLITWTDHTGKPHAACSRHAGSLKRRYPSELPPRTAPAGTLGLSTPWTRGAFAPDDVIAIENAIPAGYRINVVGLNPRRFVVVGLLEEGRDDGEYMRPLELFRTPPTGSPLQAAQAMCGRLAMHAEGAS